MSRAEVTTSEADDLAEHVLEIVAPRTNAALVSAAEHLFAALLLHAGEPRGGGLALEIAADRERRRFLARTRDLEQQRRLAGQINAAYPQAALRPLGGVASASADPARPDPDEQVAVCTLGLRGPEYLPLRTLQDREIDTDAGPAQSDPLLGILSALGDLPPNWRALAQLVILAPLPQDWGRAYERLALEHPIQVERDRSRGSSLLGPLLLVGLLGLYLAGSSTVAAWERGDWLGSVGIVGGTVLAAGLVLLGRRVLGQRRLYDPRLVQDKLSRDACRAELRLALFVPRHVAPNAIQARLRRIAAAYRPFALAAGNSLVPRPVRGHEPDLRDLRPLGRGGPGRAALLNVRELAGLWHLPQGADEAMFVERTTARRHLPLPASVAPRPGGEGCRIGTSAHQGQVVPVYLDPGLLRRHLLAIAKTRRGKSSLLLRLVHHLMLAGTAGLEGRAAGRERRCVVLVDPHHDLASAALGLVPPERHDDVVYLDVSNRERPFGINLLDVGLGWDRDQAVGNTLRIFRREWDQFWGPRMEDAFRFALMALFEANEALVDEDPAHGRMLQHTVLEVPALLSVRGFRGRVLRRTRDRLIRRWFDTYFEPLDLRLRLEIINPVQTKVHKYLGSRVARQIVGQPRSTIDFRTLIAEHKIVLIDLASFDVGEDTAALIGGTLLNLAARAISAQAVLPPEARRAVTIAVDEFHTIPGADYEQVFGELAKYGANMLLATQTLARLDRLTDAQRTRDLRAAVFSNLDGLFAFHCSAEDAAYLAPELGGQLDDQDLLELGHYECYARLSDGRSGERLPAFTVRLDPPATSDQDAARTLAEVSARRYGRDAIDVDLDLQSALARIDGPRQSGASQPQQDDYPTTPAAADGGTPAADRTVTGNTVRSGGKTKKPGRTRARKSEGGRTTRERSGSPAPEMEALEGREPEQDGRPREDL